jgi:putative spermidine/putrescine transport system substrate-binding protein
MRTYVYDPFTKATGIEVVSFTANVAKVLSMAESGQIDLDVLNYGTATTIILGRRGFLEPMDRGRFKLTNTRDIPDAIQQYHVEENVFSNVIGYNTQSFASNHPRTWAEFWDVQKFPGGRTLEDLASEFCYLEFALLADGVPMNHIYPINLDRAFKKLSEIRPSITKWWESGATSAELFSTKAVTVGGLWHTRIQALIDDKGPFAIEWNQAMRESTVRSVLKNSPNRDNAFKLIDFAMQPSVQAAVAQHVDVGPTNRRAFDHIDAATANRLPTSPDHMKVSFANNAAWWVDNRDEVQKRWQAFLLGG